MKSGDSPESVPSGPDEFLREESGWLRYGDRQTPPIVPDPCSRAWRPGFHSPPHRRDHRLGARASRQHPVPLAAAELHDAAGSHPVGGNSIGRAEGQPWRRSRLIQVGEMTECQAWCGRDARAPSKPSSHDIVPPRAPNGRSILAPLVVEEGPPVFWSIRVYSCPFVVHLHERSTVFPRMIRTAPPGRHPPGARASRPHPLPLAAAEFPAMLQAATLWASTPSARPKESQGAVPCCSKWGRWPRLCLAWCGRDARAPRKPSLCGRDARAPSQPSSHDIVTPRAQDCRSILVPLVVEEGPSVFVSIGVHSWFIFMNDRPFFLE